MRSILIVMGMVVMLATGLATAGVRPALGTGDNPGASHEKVTICHHVEGNGETGFGYNIITVNFNSIADAQSVGGHGDHEGDIIPPYTYTDLQGTVSYPGKGDQSRLPGCELPDDTTITTTTETTTTTTMPPPPECPNNPGGMPPNPPGGQDGKPGNDRCKPDETTTQTTTTPPPTTTEPTTPAPTVTTPTAPETTTSETTTLEEPTEQPSKPNKPNKPGSPENMPEVTPTSEGELPLTGLPLFIAVLFGAALLVGGFALRKL